MSIRIFYVAPDSYYDFRIQSPRKRIVSRKKQFYHNESGKDFGKEMSLNLAIGFVLV